MLNNPTKTFLQQSQDACLHGGKSNQPEALIKGTTILTVSSTSMPQLLQLSSKKSQVKKKKTTIKQQKDRFNLCLRQEATDTLSYTAGIRLGQNHVTISMQHI